MACMSAGIGTPCRKIQSFSKEIDLELLFLN